MSSSPFSTTPALLAQLAAITGSEYDHERALIAVQNAVKREGDSLSKLVATAAEVYMHVTPVRLPLAEVVWRAHHDMPVVVWSAKESRWIVITFAGWFRLRIADGEHPTHRVTISRGELVQLLGLKSVNDVVEAGIVHPERPAHDMSVHAAVAREVHTHGDGHGNGHAPHVSPVRRFLRLLKAERGDIVTLLIFSVFAGLLYLAFLLYTSDAAADLTLCVLFSCSTL